MRKKSPHLHALATGIGCQQAGLGADVTGQRLDLRPGFRCGVEVRDRFEIAMQVEHHVGVAGQSLQGQALGLQLGAGGLPGQRVAQVAADQLQVVLRIVTELAFDRVADFLAEVDEPAVEVLAAFQFVATQRQTEKRSTCTPPSTSTTKHATLSKPSKAR
ncbi:hypothetical protein Q5705_20975 [Kosakonia sp. H02]|nr:hypothetical protein Q5705_20975 [Kosakonia sp. H02]